MSFIKELPRRGYEVPFKKALLYFQHAQLPVLHPRHTVEELQSFVNVRTPSPPWVHVVRLVIPTASCDEAAVYLIKAFGGEDVMKRVVGGTKWWQVRGTRGYVDAYIYRLDAEWISAKKDWQDAKRRAKERKSSDNVPQEHTADLPEPRDPILNDIILELPLNGEADHPSEGSNGKEQSRDSADYQPELDEMRCILYAHGGMVPIIPRRLLVDIVCLRRILLWQCGPGAVSPFWFEYNPATAYATLHSKLQHPALCS